jgi:hypothetical protein
VSRFWLVELEPDLEVHKTTRTGVWCGVKGVNGVRAVTDLEAISQATLDELLLSAEQSLVTPRKRTRAVHV